MRKFDMISFSVSYWDKELSISMRQSIIVNWFQFQISFLDFVKEFFLTFLNYREWVKVKLKDILRMIFSLIVDLADGEGGASGQEQVEEEGDYEHPDLLVHFFGQFLGMTLVYQFNKKKHLEKKNKQILWMKHLLLFFQSFQIFSFSKNTFDANEFDIYGASFKIEKTTQKLIKILI